MKTITNETGTFYIDDNGVLLRYESTEINNACYNNAARYIINLTIPEGVVELSDNAFQGYNIFHDVELPASLKRLGENAFSGSHIGGVVLPENPNPDMMPQLAHRLRFVHVWSDRFIASWPQEYKDIYTGKSEPRESWQCIRNDSGSFWIDSDGVLMDFDTDLWFRPRDDKRILYKLNIPEGVTAIPSEMFRGYIVFSDISFPKSLRCIGVGYGGGCAFSDSWLPDLVLPENLEALGNFVFGSTVVRSVTIPHNPEKLLPLQARQFKDAYIGELRVPVEYRDVMHENSWKDGHEMTDPVYGQLYCARHADGYCVGIVSYLEAMRKLRKGEKE